MPRKRNVEKKYKEIEKILLEQLERWIKIQKKNEKELRYIA